MDKNLIAKYMKKYDCTEAEAIEIINDDEAVDKMTVSEIKKSYSKEELEAIKSVTKTTSDKKKTSYKFDKRERPKDEEKVEIVQKIADFLKNLYKNVEISNIGQEISLKIGENDYSIKLVKHRPPKNKEKS